MCDKENSLLDLNNKSVDNDFHKQGQTFMTNALTLDCLLYSSPVETAFNKPG